jgi:cephalosporin-C deacetylase-like acetyl esterase
MRTIDLITTRPELDATQVGCMGISGGGTTTLFSAALEPRIKAAMVSGYLNTPAERILHLEIGRIACYLGGYIGMFKSTTAFMKDSRQYRP